MTEDTEKNKKRILVDIKDSAYKLLVGSGSQSAKVYEKFVEKNPEYYSNNRLRSIYYLLRLRKAEIQKKDISKVRPPKNYESKTESINIDCRESTLSRRPGLDRFVRILKEYDIISFDI